MTTTTNTTARTPAVSVETLDTGLTLAFADGVRTTILVENLSPEIRHAAMLHGLKQKLVDAAAIPRNTDTGASATVADKKAAVLAVLDRLNQGHWNKPAEGGGAGGSGRGSLIFRALSRMQADKSAEDIEAFLGKLDDKQKAGLRANPRVAAVILEIKAEDAAKKLANGGKVEGDELLAGFMGDDSVGEALL